jgi:hypothetical protein
MEAALKTKWIEALESGRYKHSRLSLRNMAGYCCLGVLCDIVDPNGWDGNVFMYEEEGRGGYLPEKLRTDLGIQSDLETRLSVANDTADGFEKAISIIKESL